MYSLKNIPFNVNNYHTRTPAIMDVDMELDSNTVPSSIIGTNTSYYPHISLAMPATFVIPEAPDTYDPSHDYFDVR